MQRPGEGSWGLPGNAGGVCRGLWERAHPAAGLRRNVVGRRGKRATAPGMFEVSFLEKGEDGEGYMKSDLAGWPFQLTLWTRKRGRRIQCQLRQ